MILFRYLFLVVITSISSPVNAAITIGPEQQMMLEATGYVANRRYAEAEMLYSKVIALKPAHIEAWIQRSVVRREMGKDGLSANDARKAVELANAQLQRRPSDANARRDRGMGYRLLKDFPHARADFEAAIRLKPGKASWRSDLKAMEMEEKIYKGQ